MDRRRLSHAIAFSAFDAGVVTGAVAGAVAVVWPYARPDVARQMANSEQEMTDNDVKDKLSPAFLNFDIRHSLFDVRHFRFSSPPRYERRTRP
jgi:hypothetical protein